MSRAFRVSIISPESCSGCLRCSLACSFFTSPDRAFNPARSKIQVIHGQEDGLFQIELSQKCTHCGICVEYCEFGVLSNNKIAAGR